MNEALIENHNKKLKDLIYKKRLWNSLLTIIIIVGVILSSKIIDINSSRLLDGIPRLGDYVSQILPSLDSPSLLLDSKTEGSIA